MFSSLLPSYTSVENNINEGGNGNHISNGCKSRIFSQKVPRIGTIFLDKSFEVHIFQHCFLHYSESDLDRFSFKEKTTEVTEGVFGGTTIEVTEEGDF